MKMKDEQMIKEIIERRRKCRETRSSDFDWLINTIDRQQREIDYLNKRKEEILVESGRDYTKLFEIKEILNR